MLTATIHDLTLFENFLTIINKFVQQCEFDLYNSGVHVYCVNPRDFSSARLLLDSDVITLDKNDKTKNVKVYIRDVIAFKSAISIVKEVEDVTEITVDLEDIDQSKTKINKDDEDILIKSIKYKSKNGGKFNLITVDKSVIIDYVSKELKRALKKDLEFNILPKNLEILQNRTGNVVNIDEVSIYIYPDEKKKVIMLDLTSKSSSSTNSIALPISETYTGSLNNFPYKEIAIHESAFRIFNILRTNDSSNLNCFFNVENNVFFIESKIASETNYNIHSRLLVQMIKGK